MTLRPEVLKFAQLINDAIDDNERAAPEFILARSFWNGLEAPRLWQELDNALGLIEEWFDSYRQYWKSDLPAHRETLLSDFQFNALLLCALGKAVGLLEVVPKEQLAMALEDGVQVPASGRALREG